MALFKLFKPKKPLEIDGNYVYPLTSADQVIKSDGKRLESEGGINADTLGGKVPSEYASAEDVGKMAPKNHAATSVIYGRGNADNYGHVRLSDSVEWTSAKEDAGIAATPSAVQHVYGIASAAMPKKGGTFSGKVVFKTDTDFLVDETVLYRFRLDTGSTSNPNALVLQVYDPNAWVVNPLTVDTDGSITIKSKTTLNAQVHHKKDASFDTDVGSSYKLPNGGLVKFVGHTSTGGLIASVYDENGEWLGNAFAILEDATTRFQKPAIANSPADDMVRLRNGVIQDSAGTAVNSSYLIYRRK